ncbi:hypothetical protein GQ54DRAFT_79058 [Martensiomyces pterosporus]|nr:hypothetical protein GQ54DRAFT_79058 [Martensiomyces pterosporus]
MAAVVCREGGGAFFMKQSLPHTQNTHAHSPCCCGQVWMRQAGRLPGCISSQHGRCVWCMCHVALAPRACSSTSRTALATRYSATPSSHSYDLGSPFPASLFLHKPPTSPKHNTMRLGGTAGYIILMAAAGVSMTIAGQTAPSELQSAAQLQPLARKPTTPLASQADPPHRHVSRGMVFEKRRLVAEDPANPVAAAATDPNEAAMKIKSRDLIPTDRPESPFHRHRHGRQDDGAQEDGSEAGNGERSAPKRSSGGGDGSSAKRKTVAKDEDTNEGSDDSRSMDTKSKPKPKPSSKGTKGSGDGEKDSAKKPKGNPDAKDRNNKKTHTGLDGNEVDDQDDDSEDMKKKIQVEHVKAMKRRWRTGTPKYDYQKALDGWKKVGPMYYYKGKYANAATSVLASQGIGVIATAIAVPAMSAVVLAMLP